MPDSLRCSLCGITWPYVPRDYGTCPECGEKTDRFTKSTPISEDEARSRKAHAEFERYYREREERQLAEELDQLTGAV